VTGFKQLSQEELEAWQASPATVAIKDCLQRAHRMQVQHSQQAYWAGNQVSDARRLALQMYGDFIGDVFEATVGDFEATMEQIDEFEKQQRDNAR
jgi:hypothetical protein